ncbi:MAG: hypothetical protein ACLT8L_05900 [Streptococcus salivarius]
MQSLTSAKANVVATGGFTATEEAGVKHTSVESLLTMTTKFKQQL